MTVTRLAAACLALLTVSATAARAQAPVGEESRFYGVFTVAATLGHKSDSSVGGELGWHFAPDLMMTGDSLALFVEGGRMGNVATVTADDNARNIADFLSRTFGGTSSAAVVQKARFFDIGVKYRGPEFARMWTPYVGLGVGVASVRTISTFILNGVDVTSELENTYQITLGQDLSDSTAKAFIVVPVGVQAHFLKRYVVDGSYRYGRIAARTSEIPEDVPINTQRVQVGIGVRF